MSTRPPSRRFDRARRAVGLVRAMVTLHPKVFAVAVTGASLFALFTVGASMAVRWVVDHVIEPRFEAGAVALGTLLGGLAIVVGIGVARACAVVVRRSFAGITQWRVAETLSSQVVHRLVRQPASWHHRRPDGDLVARAGVDVDASVAVLAPIPFATGTVILLVVSSVWLFLTDVVIGSVAVTVFPILLMLNVVYQRRVDRHYDDAQRHLGAFSAGVHESFEGVQLVKAYGAELRETTRLSSMAGDVRDARVRAVRLRATFESMLELVPGLANVVLVVVGAHRVSTGDLTIGELSSVIFLFGLLIFPLRLIGWTLSELPRSMAGWNRVRAVLDEPIDPDPRARIELAPPGTGIELEAVQYTHVGEAQPALRDLSLTVPGGLTVAVVGPTGAGKSTLVDVVAGLVEPSRGVVRLAAGDRAVVFQEAFLFAGTVRDNLQVGAGFSDEELWEALRLAAADDVVRQLPSALDTVVGERGVSLSGGQRQRLALARALIRRPSVLVLDDTTSALDPTTEATVLGNISEALASTTVLMVASRPSTIALADRVVFIQNGSLVAEGLHGDLFAREPTYRELVEAFEADRDGATPGSRVTP
jgi:ATP-binding cassette, subfamily B, bacterial